MLLHSLYTVTTTHLGIFFTDHRLNAENRLTNVAPVYPLSLYHLLCYYYISLTHICLDIHACVEPGGVT